MTLKFPKDIVNKYSLATFEQVRHGKLYQVIDNENTTSQFLISDKNSYLKHGDKTLIIDGRSKDIIETENSYRIGHFHFSRWTILVGYRDTLTFKDKEYLFKKVKPDIGYSLFNKSTWGQFKLQLACDEETISYSFKIDIPSISIATFYQQSLLVVQLNIQIPIFL